MAFITQKRKSGALGQSTVNSTVNYVAERYQNSQGMKYLGSFRISSTKNRIRKHLGMARRILVSDPTTKVLCVYMCI